MPCRLRHLSTTFNIASLLAAGMMPAAASTFIVAVAATAAVGISLPTRAVITGSAATATSSSATTSSAVVTAATFVTTASR